MDDRDTARILASVPLFAGLEERDLLAVAGIGRHRKLGRGETLFLDGAPAEGLFVVLTGTVKLAKLNPAGKEQILHVHAPGETFAEATLAEGSRYPAGAAALDAAEVLLVPRAALQRLLGQRPVLATNLIARLSERLREMAALVEDLSLREAPARLARYLLDLAGDAKQSGVALYLPIRKTELAAFLGTRQETLSRALRQLMDTGLIEVRGAEVTILDFDELDLLAEGLE